MSAFEFKLDAFEGPLDLLLFLVNRHKLNIYDIEISLLLDQYLEYINGLEEEDFDQAGEFLAMAARLVYIKTCSLLPRAEEAEELKKELEGELIEYSVCKEAAALLRDMSVYGDVFVRPPEKLPVNKVFTGTIDPGKLLEAYLGMSAKARSMKPVRAEQFKPIVASRIVTVTSKIVHVLKMLYTLGRCTVGELYEGVEDKSARVATFLAVLELTRSGRIMLNEDNTVITFNRDAPRRKRQPVPAEERERERKREEITEENRVPVYAAAAEAVPDESGAAVTEAEPFSDRDEPAAAGSDSYDGYYDDDDYDYDDNNCNESEETVLEAVPADDPTEETEPVRVTVYGRAERVERVEKYVGAARYGGMTKTLEPLPAAPQAQQEEAPAETVERHGEIIAVKQNRFACRYYWGYPAADRNCRQYRRERL